MYYEKYISYFKFTSTPNAVEIVKKWCCKNTNTINFFLYFCLRKTYN